MSYNSDLLKISDVLAQQSGKRDSDWLANLSDALEAMALSAQSCSMSRVILLSAAESLNSIGQDEEDGAFLDMAELLEEYAKDLAK